MGLFEAFMKIFPEMKMKDGNIGVEYVPLGKPDEISRYLVRVDEEKNYADKEIFPIKDREGLYYEKPNVVDKYMRRGEELKEICLAQFVKMYDAATSVVKADNNIESDEEIEDNNEEGNSEEQGDEKDKLKIKYGSEAKFHSLIKYNGTPGKPLPPQIKLINPLPNEPIFMKKRNSPKALRFYKPKADTNPGRYYLQELLLYKSFNKQMFDRWTKSDENCRKDYMAASDNIKKVKQIIMEWLEDVEEARLYVEETLQNEASTEEIGNAVDAEKEQEIHECEEEGIEEDPMYCHLNPEGLLENLYVSNLGGAKTKQLIIEETEILYVRTQQLDQWQKRVVDIGIKFARDTVKSRKAPNNTPVAPKLVVTGGAGAGKSTVIEVLCQWMHKILQKPGDDPDCPYVMKTATTGAAGVLIEGVTLHSALKFNFENKHSSMTDKKREEMREIFKNLKAIIVDEFSMMKPEILYRMDLRLKEIKLNNKDFGGVGVFLFGDLLQVFYT